MADIRTNIKQIPVVNEKLYKDTAAIHGTSTEQVEDIIKFIGGFIHDTINRGLMESVMLPGFGKFQPKRKLLVGKHKAILNRNSGMASILKAATGREVINFDELKPDTNETV